MDLLNLSRMSQVQAVGGFANSVVSIPGLTAPNGRAGPLKTLPPLKDEFTTGPCVPIKRSTQPVRFKEAALAASAMADIESSSHFIAAYFEKLKCKEGSILEKSENHLPPKLDACLQEITGHRSPYLKDVEDPSMPDGGRMLMLWTAIDGLRSLA